MWWGELAPLSTAQQENTEGHAETLLCTCYGFRPPRIWEQLVTHQLRKELSMCRREDVHTQEQRNSDKVSLRDRKWDTDAIHKEEGHKERRCVGAEHVHGEREDRIQKGQEEPCKGLGISVATNIPRCWLPILVMLWTALSFAMETPWSIVTWSHSQGRWLAMGCRDELFQ